MSRGVFGLSLGDKVTVLWYGIRCSILKNEHRHTRMWKVQFFVVVEYAPGNIRKLCHKFARSQ